MLLPLARCSHSHSSTRVHRALCVISGLARIRRKAGKGSSRCCCTPSPSWGLLRALGEITRICAGAAPMFSRVPLFFPGRASVCLSALLSQEADTVYLEILEVLSCLVLSCLVLSCLVLSSLVLSCFVTASNCNHSGRGEFSSAG